MEASENHFIARMKGGIRHEEEPWEPREVRDTSIANYERVLGHAMLAGEIDAEEALKALSNYAAWQISTDTDIDL